MFTAKRVLGSAISLMVILSVGFISMADAQGEKEFGKEQRLTKKDLPASIITAFQKQYPNAKIKEVGKEVEDSTTYYELETTEGKAVRTLIYIGDGRITEIEEVILSKQLPDSAQASIAKDYPKGKVEAAEKVNKGDKTTYEVKIENGNENIEAVFDSNGKLINMEKMKGEEDND